MFAKWSNDEKEQDSINNKVILYNANTIEDFTPVKNYKQNTRNDLGYGLYLTDNEQSANEWGYSLLISQYNTQRYVHVYEYTEIDEIFDFNKLPFIKLLSTVISNRIDKEEIDKIKDNDIYNTIISNIINLENLNSIKSKRIDDNLVSIFNAFTQKQITIEQAEFIALKYNLGNQYLIRNNKLAGLKHIKTYMIDKEYQGKFDKKSLTVKEQLNSMIKNNRDMENYYLTKNRK